jgi:diguanylate cyclase (GGDEF)-like protein/PAS domain S-box-containing protein
MSELPDPRIIISALDYHSIISIADVNGNITYANDKFCEISKYSHDELIGQNHRLLKSGSHGAKFFDDMWLTIVNGRTWQGEVCNRSKDGSLYWVETTIVPSLDKNGLPYQFVSIRTDITRLKSIETDLAKGKAELEMRVMERTTDLQLEMEEMREKEQRFKQLAENIQDVFWMTDPAKQKMIYASPAYEQIWGRTLQSLYELPQTWLESVYEEDKQRVFQAALTKQVPGLYDEEYRIVRPNGEIRWIHDKAFPLSDSNGVVYRMVGVAEDITDRKLVENKLAKSEQHFRAVMQSASDGIVTGTEIGNIEGWNAAAERLFGYTETEVIGQSITILIPERYRSSHNAGLARVAAGGAKHIIGKTVEVVGLHKNGNEIPLELSVAQWQTSDGQHFNAIIRDISVRKNAEEKLRIAAAAFETHEAILITDANANIIHTNRAFTEITGYSQDEVLGKNPHVLSSGRHDKAFYASMWQQLLNTDSWTGEVWDRRKNGQIYPKWLTITAVKSDAGKTTEYVGIFSDVTLRKKAENEIHKLAFYDPLTGLPNRRLLNDRLQQLMASSGRRRQQNALLFLDLDNFKTLNDTLGHDIGDLLLKQVAKRLTTCVRNGDTVARLGGDEFVVVLEDLSEHVIEAAAQTEAVGEKILASIGQPYRLATHEYNCTPSIGMIIFNAHGEKKIDELLKYADIAMYQAKKAGRNTLRFFDPQMQDSINARVALENDLRKAIELKQFQLYYQIQVDSSHHPLGAEALIRWVHPERGLVSATT